MKYHQETGEGSKTEVHSALFKALSTKLCFEQMSIRETQQALAERNMEGVASEALPIVSAATIQRYVTNASLMDQNELVPLSFAQCTVRGPCSNSESNKDIRIEKMTELDRYMRAGFTLVFVDESHWNLANVRTRKWGKRGRGDTTRGPTREYS